MMNIDEIKSKIRDLKYEIKQNYKAEIVGIFGSYARGEPEESSDIDILVSFEKGATLFDLTGLGDFLEEKLGAKVDIVSLRALRDEIRDKVIRELVTV